MTTLTTKLLRGSIIAGLALAPVSAFAQDTTAPDTDTVQQGAPETTAPEMQAADFTDAQLEGFIEATVKLQELQTTYLPQIEAAETDADKRALAEEARTEMTSAVEETEGLDVETYNRIGQAAQTDEELNARLVAMLQDRAPTDGVGAAPRDEG
ncbi:DUF4168 domain-containing protein [Pseudooceanicola sp.]|uniref:DUF4168 domain-containing protein n=1 Tax=Pseudooceanicola sp. TaxID=1914328 RepID=UPI00405808D2